MREEKYSRHWKILTFILDHRTGKRIDEIAQEIECCERTVRRDLLMLQDAGFPICSERTARGTVWTMLESFRNIPPVPFTSLDALAMVVARSALAARGNGFYRQIDGILDRLKANRGEDFRRHLDRLEGSVYYKPGRRPGGAADRGDVMPGIYDEITKAVMNHRVLVVTYRNAKGITTAGRRLAPHHLRVDSDIVYLRAYCLQSSAMRTFALTRFLQVTCTDETFRQTWTDDEESASEAIGVFLADAEDIVLDFDPILEQYFELHPLHASQQATHRDGHLRMTLRVGINESLIHHLTGFGRRVTVVSPPHLAALVAQRHAESIGLDAAPPAGQANQEAASS